jgi:hypothetical protein
VSAAEVAFTHRAAKERVVMTVLKMMILPIVVVPEIW